MSDELGEPKGHLKLVHSDVEPPAPCEGVGLLDIDWDSIAPKEVSSNPFPWARAIREQKGGYLRVQLDHDNYVDIPFKKAKHAMVLATDLVMIAVAMLYHEEGK